MIFPDDTSTSDHRDVVDEEDDDDDIQELYITQKLDHFDGTNLATYQQRYFVSYRYHTHSTAQVVSFLCVGGEGPGFDKSVLDNSVHCSGDMVELAKRLNEQFGMNVHLYALEHRYYGQSYPTFVDPVTGDETSPLTTTNLKYLSSRQALEDLAHFVHVMKTSESLHSIDEENGGTIDEENSLVVPWVTFGGSYPGFMAAMARYKYPHLIYAAVSSSAPLQLEVDFPGYKERQGYDLTYTKVGGSDECHRIVQTGHQQAVSLLETVPNNNNNSSINGPVELAKMFNLCNPETALSTRRNQELLLGDGLINIPAQGNDPSCTWSDTCNIAGLCRFITTEYQQRVERIQRHDEPLNGSANDDGRINYLTTYVELEVLAKVAQHQAQAAAAATAARSTTTGTGNGKNEDTNDPSDPNDDKDCLDVDFQAVLELYSKTDVDASGDRSWLWQTCTEVGFYQTCTSDRCPFAKHYHQVDLDLEICQYVYNISTQDVYDNVQASLDHYGGLDIVNTDSAASRILSINGDVDPWSVLGLQEGQSTTYSLPIKMVPGASHHFWTHAVKDTDAVEIVEIREYLYSVVIGWLGIHSNQQQRQQQHQQQDYLDQQQPRSETNEPNVEGRDSFGKDTPSSIYSLRGMMRGPFEMILY